MTDPGEMLIRVSSEARERLARPGNDFGWWHWKDADTALREVDGLIAMSEAGHPPELLAVRISFAPTGSIREVSLSSGGAWEFLDLASRFDAVAIKATPPRGPSQGRSPGAVGSIDLFN